MEQIGPMKIFINKKAMWVKIKLDIKDQFGYFFTELQIENRYKTVLKRNIANIFNKHLFKFKFFAKLVKTVNK